MAASAHEGSWRQQSWPFCWKVLESAGGAGRWPGEPAKPAGACGVSACRVGVPRCVRSHPTCGLSQRKLCVRFWLFPPGFSSLSPLRRRESGGGGHAFCETVILYFITKKRPTLEGPIKSSLSLFNGIWMNRVKCALCIH